MDGNLVAAAATHDVIPQLPFGREAVIVRVNAHRVNALLHRYLAITDPRWPKVVDEVKEFAEARIREHIRPSALGERGTLHCGGTRCDRIAFRNTVTFCWL